MRLLRSVSSGVLSAACGLALAGTSVGQGRLVDVDPHPGVLYCSNQVPAMLCTDDAGATWHPLEYFRGRYRKGVVLSDTGKATSETVRVPAPEPEQQRKPAEPTAPGPREVMLGVQINGRPASDAAQLLQGEDGKIYVPSDLIAQWRLQVLQGRSVTFNGKVYFPLDAINGVQWALDPASQTLSLTVLPSAFAPSTVDASYRELLEPSVPQPGLFLNHQLVYTHASSQSGIAGLFEGGYFSSLGVLTSRFAEKDFTSSISPIRLDTKLAREFPNQMALLTVGDSISAVNTWSRQVTYAGISWASDFATQPTFVPIVLPNLQGQAAQPSTVDIYVNGVRTSQQKVDPGPFTINNIPVISGQGDVQMVVTDVLGRQQVVTQSYITAQELLRTGVNAYTYETGILRRNFGTVSSQYGSLFAEGQQRHGFTDRLTGNARVEVSGKQQTGGVGAELGITPFGVIGTGVALSHSNLGPGGLAYLALVRRSKRLGYSGTIQTASSTFQQLGMAAGERAFKLQAQFQVAEALGSRASIAVGYLRQQNRTFVNGVQAAKPDFAGISTTFNARVASRLYLTASANLSNSFKNASSATISLVVPLGKRSLVSATSTVARDGTQLSSVTYAQQPPLGPGYGYRVRGDIGDTSNQRRVDADFTYQTSTGSYELEGSEVASKVATRFTETGALVFMGGHIIPSQLLNSSFAVVEVPDLSGVKVFANNQYIAKTSWRGLAVLPTLAPYAKNVIRLDDQGVPVELDMDLQEKTVVPMSRTGVLLRFKALHMAGALFQLVTEKGDPVPVGAEVTVGEFGTIYNTAYRGEVFIPNISFPAHLHASWAGQRCDANVESSNTREPLPRIGPVTCKVVP
jgi:outer membrane usher protein